MRKVNLNIFIWMALSIVCFSIFKAYMLIEEKEMNTILLVGLYAFIGIFTFYKLAKCLDEIRLFKDKILHCFWVTNGIVIPVSVFLIVNHPQLLSYLIYQFIILTIIGIIVNGVNELKRRKNVQSKKKNKT